MYFDGDTVETPFTHSDQEMNSTVVTRQV